jgi:hypothetical protein
MWDGFAFLHGILLLVKKAWEWRKKKKCGGVRGDTERSWWSGKEVERALNRRKREKVIEN